MDKITFRNLPFTPTARQVIFVETDFDATLNAFFTTHFHELRRRFQRIGKEFYYLPLLTRDYNIERKVLYFAPYLSRKVLASTPIKSSSTLKFATDVEARTLRPSLIFNAVHNSETQESVFDIVPLDGVTTVAEIIGLFVPDTKEACRKHPTACCFEPEEAVCHMAMRKPFPQENEDGGILEKVMSNAAPVLPMPTERMESRKPRASMKVRFMKSFSRMFDEEETEVAEEVPTLSEIEEEEMSAMETRRILQELKENVQRLRLEGVSLMAIHEFIDRQETLSPMVITEDYRIFLPEFNNMEIEMGALPKALYFLFLRYPEGIVCKHMPDHYGELLSIYRQLRPRTDEARLNLTITKIVNPLGNALNENIARIRKAFVDKFDEHLAANYIISGERSQQYSIPLDRNLITWEE